MLGGTLNPENLAYHHQEAQSKQKIDLSHAITGYCYYHFWWNKRICRLHAKRREK